MEAESPARERSGVHLLHRQSPQQPANQALKKRRLHRKSLRLSLSPSAKNPTTTKATTTRQPPQGLSQNCDFRHYLRQRPDRVHRGALLPWHSPILHPYRTMYGPRFSTTRILAPRSASGSNIVNGTALQSMAIWWCRRFPRLHLRKQENCFGRRRKL